MTNKFDSDMSWYYPYQVQTMEALWPQILGRGERYPRDPGPSDPCDEWPVFYWMGQPVPLLTDEDRLLARVLRYNVNAQYGKFGAGIDLIVIDEAHHIPRGTFREVLDAYAKDFTVEGNFSVDFKNQAEIDKFLDDIPAKEVCQTPDKGYDYQRHNKVRKRRP